MAMARIFVSYSSKDVEWTTQLVEAFKAVGLDVWYDQKGIYVGEQWVDKLEQELQRRDIFLIVLTPDSWSSEWVRKELHLALVQHKHILGVIHKPVEVSGFISTYQLLDVIEKAPNSAANEIIMTLRAGDIQSANATSGQPPSAKIPLSHKPSLVGLWREELGETDRVRSSWILNITSDGRDGRISGIAQSGIWFFTEYGGTFVDEMEFPLEGEREGTRVQLRIVADGYRPDILSLDFDGPDMLVGTMSVSSLSLTYSIEFVRVKHLGVGTDEG